MKKICSFICLLLITIGIFAGCSAKTSNDAQTNSIKNFGTSKKVVIIVLDGFSSNYLNYLGKNSNIYKLLSKSTYNLSSSTVYPSHTCSAHTTIMTGCYPEKHNIIGNVFYNSKTSTSDKNIDPNRIKTATIFSVAKNEGMQTAIVSGKDNLVKLFEKDCDIKVSPKNYPEYIEKAPTIEDSDNNDEYFKYNIDTTKWVFNSLEKVLKEKSPDVVLVNIQSPDYIGHRFGPESDEIKQVINDLDKCIGQFNKFMIKNKLINETSIVITSDHGMTSVTKAIPLNVLVSNNFEKAAGLVDGRNAYIWLNGDDENKVVSFFEKQEGIDKIIIKNSDESKNLKIFNNDCPDIILNSKPDYLFIPEALLYKYKGMHGSLDETDTIVPIIWFGCGIPQNKNIENSSLLDLMPTACKLLNIETGKIDGKVPEINNSININYFR